MLKLFVENSNFRSFLLFQAFSSIGSGMFGIFVMWAIYIQFQNPFYLGIAGFMFVFPNIASFIVGPLIDRCSKVTFIRIACFVKLLTICFLSIFYDYQHGVWFLHLAILAVSIAGVLGIPAGAALLPRIVNMEDLIKANALIMIVSTITGLSVGALLLAIMVDNTNFERVYAINTGILLIALILSVFIRGQELQEPETKVGELLLKTYFAELKIGIKFIKQGVIWHLTLAFIFVNLFTEVASVNLPLFAETHTGTASGYIILMTLALMGAIVGPYVSRIIAPRFELSKIIIVGFVTTGVFRIIFANVISDNFVGALLIYVLYVGLGNTVNIFVYTLMQKLPPRHIIARVNTIRLSISSIAAAIGALLGGLMGTFLSNVDMIIVIHGISYIAIGMCLRLSKQIRNLQKINDVVSIAEL